MQWRKISFIMGNRIEIGIRDALLERFILLLASIEALNIIFCVSAVTISSRYKCYKCKENSLYKNTKYEK